MVTFAMPFKKETRTYNRQKCDYPEKTLAGNIWAGISNGGMGMLLFVVIRQAGLF